LPLPQSLAARPIHIVVALAVHLIIIICVLLFIVTFRFQFDGAPEHTAQPHPHSTLKENQETQPETE